MPDAVTFVGHSTVLIELGGMRILTDPLLRGRFLHARRIAPPPAEGLLDEVDVVLVSHLHMDHLDFPSIRGLDRRVPFVVTKGGGRVLRRRGFRDVTEVDPGEKLSLGPVGLEATDARHDGRRWPVGLAVEALGYLLRSSTASVYFAGDTDLYEGMSELAGRVDLALLPIGGWGPRVGEGHLDGHSAAEAAARIQPRCVVPIHWGTYLRFDLVGRRPDLVAEQPRTLLADTSRLAPGVDVRVLAPGETLRID
ncbi:MAG: MBL fold metallo-hydrolase [Solirubrobacterales bacterium]